MKRIIIEEHFLINEPTYIDRWMSMAPNFPKAEADKLLPALVDVGEQRLEAMAKAEIDYMVLSSIGIVQGVLDAAPAMQIATRTNDYLAEVIRKDSQHFGGFATVPLQDPEAGAKELERAIRELGMKGVMIFGQTNGKYLDDECFRPFWERAEALDAPVYLHAADPVMLPLVYAGHPEMTGSTWSWVGETSAHTLRLVFGGVFDRYPKIKFLLGHMGETIPYMLARLDTRAEAFKMSIKPSDVIKRNVFITSTGVFADAPLICALDVLGEDSVMYSVDHPFESMAKASAWFDKAPLSESVREKVSCGNATRILKL